MEKLSRWIIKHNRGMNAFCLIFWGALAIFVYILLKLDWSLILALVIYYGGVYYSVRFIGTRTDYLFRMPLAQLYDHCDPYPFIQEVETLQTYSLSESMKQQMVINQTMGLQMIGEYEKAYALLCSMNIYESKLGLGNRTVYFTNRMDLCACMGKYQEANIFYEKAVRMFTDLKPGRIKQILAPLMESNRALYHFCNEEYEQALRCLDQVKPKNLKNRVENTMLYGRIYLAMGEREKAVEPLRFVAEKGNKLYFATEARELLAKINTEEQ